MKITKVFYSRGGRTAGGWLKLSKNWEMLMVEDFFEAKFFCLETIGRFGQIKG